VTARVYWTETYMRCLAADWRAAHERPDWQPLPMRQATIVDLPTVPRSQAALWPRVRRPDIEEPRPWTGHVKDV
jgi:hypothetical protein